MKLAVLLVVGLAACCSTAPAAEKQPDRIVFLDVTLTNGEVRLENVNIVDGTLKRRKSVRLIPDHLHYAIHSASDETLYEGVIADPSILRVEYEDERGNLQMRTVERDPSRFSIRFPYDEAAHRVTLHRIGESEAGAEKRSPQAELIGSLFIDLAGATDED